MLKITQPSTWDIMRVLEKEIASYLFYRENNHLSTSHDTKDIVLSSLPNSLPFSNFLRNLHANSYADFETKYNQDLLVLLWFSKDLKETNLGGLLDVVNTKLWRSLSIDIRHPSPGMCQQQHQPQGLLEITEEANINSENKSQRGADKREKGKSQGKWRTWRGHSKDISA